MLTAVSSKLKTESKEFEVIRSEVSFALWENYVYENVLTTSGSMKASFSTPQKDPKQVFLPY